MQACKDLPAIDRLAHDLLQRRLPLEPALQAYKRYLAYKPDSANAAFNHAYYLARDGQFEAAVEQYRHALRLGIDTPEEVHLNIANIFIDHLKNPEEARTCLQEALGIKPDYASAYYNLGNLSEQEGDRVEAQRCFELCLEFDPSNESALARLADAHIFRDADDALVSRLESISQCSKNSDVFFALGRAYEQLSQFDLAWANFSRANQLDKQVLPAYDRVATESVFRRIMSRCNGQWLKSFQGESDQAVFICGMFRSGSTLLEQVLAAHPAFVAGGESEFFPRLVAREFPHYPVGLADMTNDRTRYWQAQHKEWSLKLYGDAVRVTDKRPDNFLHIGLIKAVLPSAKFLVTERDWRDVATSVYSTRLGAGQNYATSLENIHHYIGLQKELVDHWQSIFGSDLLRVRYEDLVAEPRATITTVLNELGEAWDERCLSFDTLNNTVQTASVWQVREPLHTKSVGRWRHYRQFFENAFGVESVTSTG
jgi:tetratricopeptide (TPR) repeat protein